MVIHWELCKILKFDHTNKEYLHNPESLQENKTLKLLWDFEIQIDHLISARRPDLIIINKKKKKKEEKWQNCGLCYPGWLQSKIERKLKEGWIPGPCKGIEKNVEHESNGDTNCRWCSCYNHQNTGWLVNKRMSGDNPNCSSVEIAQNTEKSPGDLQWLVAQTPGKDHRLTLMWKTLKE